MRVLVTGIHSQLAQSIKEAAPNFPQLEIDFACRPELDLCEPGNAASVIADRSPEIVINAAAYTAVDRAESEPELAFRINADAAGEIAAAARQVSASIVQISTDYVLDGTAHSPYREDAPTAPINVYGRSKLAGEEQVRTNTPDHLIIRTSWVYSPFGSNFVKTMLKLAADRDEVRVVDDQMGCPTSALDLARALLAAVAAMPRWGRTYNLAGSGSCSWAEFASEIFEVSKTRGGPAARVIGIPSADYPTAAARPRYSVLDSSRFDKDFDIGLPDWRESLEEVVDRLTGPSFG